MTISTPTQVDNRVLACSRLTSLHAHLRSNSLSVLRPPMLAGTRRSMLLATFKRCSLRNWPMLSGRLCRLFVLRSSLTSALQAPMLSGKASIRLFSRRKTCRDAMRARPSPISEMVLLDKSSSLHRGGMKSVIRITMFVYSSSQRVRYVQGKSCLSRAVCSEHLYMV